MKLLNRIFFWLTISSGILGLLIAYFLMSAMTICDDKAKAAGMEWFFDEDGCHLWEAP